jgi:hypothetical protein
VTAPQSLPLAVFAVAGGALLAVLLWASRRPEAAAELGLELGAAAGRTAGNVAAGAVLGVGDAVGVPRTDANKCREDLAAGRWWDASFSCPAGDFLDGVIRGAPAREGGASGSW